MAQGYEGLLGPELAREYRNQRLSKGLLNFGNLLLSAAGRGRMPVPQGGGLLEMMQMQDVAEKRRKQQAMESQYSSMVGGYDPQSGIDWQEGRKSGGIGPQYAMAQGGGPTPQAAGLLREPQGSPLLEGLNEQQIGLLRATEPEAGMKLLMERALDPPEKYKTVKNPYGLGGIGQRSTKTGQVSGYQKPDAQLTEIYDPTSPTRTRLLSRKDAAGKPGKPPSSLMKITGYDESGRPLIEVGGRGGPGLEKKTRGNIEGELFKAREGLARLETIAAGFKPEYQQFDTRFGAAWTAFKEKFGSLPGIPEEIAPEDRAVLNDYTLYRRDAIDNLNRYIKEMTGAAMSLPEAQRIRKGVPDSGEGVFDGDSPTEFKAKLLGTMRSLKLATARYSYSLRSGLDWREIDLDEMEGIMRERMGTLEQEIRARNPKIGQSALDRLLSHTLGVEFGLLGAD